MFKTDLTGLDGSNLLAYLAALGTLRVLTLADASAGVRMEWVDRGAWVPVLHHPSAGSGDEILSLLEPLVCGEDTIDASWKIGKDLTLSCSDFGEVMRASLGDASHGKRTSVDFLAAFGADVYGAGPKREVMSDTAFRTLY